jgi:hypothetical protein
MILEHIDFNKLKEEYESLYLENKLLKHKVQELLKK